MDRVRPGSGSRTLPNLQAEEFDLTRRLRIAGLSYLRIDHLLGRTRLGSLYLAIDRRGDRAVTVKVIDDDLAYDVGAADFLRGLGDARETWKPQILNPGRAPDGRGTLCYISSFVPGISLRQALEPGDPLDVSRALWIASELAGAVDSWHRREEAHGGIDAEAVLLQSGQVVVVPPPQLLHGALARRQDVRAVAALALALWQRTAPIPDLGQRFTPLVDTLRAAAEPGSPSLLPMTRLSELLREAGEIASRPPRQGLLARLFGRS